MKAEIINIGDEILIGQIINTNAVWLAQELNSIGDWSYYDGDYHGTEVDDFDENSLDVDEIEEVKEGYNESILNKLVVENTSEVVNSLDKKTLLELKKLIDSKLRII
jgi:hypothetical protein